MPPDAYHTNLLSHTHMHIQTIKRAEIWCVLTSTANILRPHTHTHKRNLVSKYVLTPRIKVHTNKTLLKYNLLKFRTKKIKSLYYDYFGVDFLLNWIDKSSSCSNRMEGSKTLSLWSLCLCLNWDTDNWEYSKKDMPDPVLIWKNVESNLVLKSA